jgi:hypothetical protein
MQRVILACRTLEQELLTAMAAENCHDPICWLEGGVHNVPDKRRQEIQSALDSLPPCDTVLLAMSLCGGSISGLQTRDFRMVVPRCDDCITLLLGSQQARMAYPATYFLTEGWLKGDRNIWNEYQYCLKKYGPQRTKRVFSAMLAHYQDLALVNTGCESPDIENQMQEIARSLALNYRRIPGTLDYLLQLLQDNWDDARFLVVSPNRTVPGERSAL